MRDNHWRDVRPELPGMGALNLRIGIIITRQTGLYSRRAFVMGLTVERHCPWRHRAPRVLSTRVIYYHRLLIEVKYRARSAPRNCIAQRYISRDISKPRG